MLELSVFNALCHEILCKPDLLRVEVHVLIPCKFIQNNYQYPNQYNLRKILNYKRNITRSFAAGLYLPTGDHFTKIHQIKLNTKYLDK